MRIGITTSVYNRDLAMIRDHGYECIDYDLCDTKKEIYHLPEEQFTAAVTAENERIKALGLTVSQVHGPWPTDDKSEESRAEKMIYMQCAVRATKLLESKYMVVHPVMPYGWGEEQDADIALQMNCDFFTALCDYAAPYGVTVCVENMPMKAHRISPMPRIVELVKKVDHPNLGICLDTGHCNVFGDDAGEAVRLSAPYLKVLHVHDNDGKRDQHLFPYMGSVNWEGFSAALKDVGFGGALSLECKLTQKMPAPLREQALLLLKDIALQLANR